MNEMFCSVERVCRWTYGFARRSGLIDLISGVVAQRLVEAFRIAENVIKENMRNCVKHSDANAVAAYEKFKKKSVANKLLSKFCVLFDKYYAIMFGIID
jgi:hypothetical protein